MDDRTETITWIPVEERLPGVDRGGVYADPARLVLISLKDCERSSAGHYSRGRWLSKSGFAVSGVVAWAEMPKGMT